ncbi:hypothetical protein CYLTODRAFT_424065 [Cylindrobasidium torrendii FP15055 ss-10]|uniref:G-protein coupled receptors family 2 profile 2 domain-containing protein n=1 Tax=Cylindrobasidium torrendii FP15055 ss-10 TaxID=1314674 RepID=A0A0D7B5K1_9AGAR|nr:hypothetical protein CYLTODRAFT_424065 [Cylindrobasidium torrendii FP15055 ss-10]
MPSMDSGYLLTEADNAISLKLWAYSSFVGGGLCALVLLIIGAVLLHPESRKHLDRVSFRVMAWALLANMVFGIANGCAGLTPTGTGCTVEVWVVQLTLQLSTFLLFCVALNLQLVLVHGINGQKMEKYYYICSVSLAMALTIPPLAAKQYGYDELTDACWYASSDRTERLRWQVSTQILWSIICSVGELVTFATVLYHMLRHQVLHGHARSRSISTVGTRSRAGSVDAHNLPKPPANVYRGVIMRIALYPLASLVINSITVACDLYASVSSGVKTRTAFRILLLNDFCYGGRSVVYALLALSDPALVRALTTLWRVAMNKTDATSNDTSTGGPKTNLSQTQITVHIELNEIRQLDDGTQLPPTQSLKDMANSDMSNASISKDMEAESGVTFDANATRLENMRRAQIGRAMDMRQEAQERKQERKDFKKQI